MLLTEIINNKSQAKQKLLKIQELLLNAHPTFETKLGYLTDANDFTDNGITLIQSLAHNADHEYAVMSVTVLDMKPKVELYIDTHSLEVVVYNDTIGRMINNSFAENDVYELMWREFANQCKLERSSDRDIEAVFRADVETGNVRSIHDVIEVVIDKDDEEGFNNLEKKYNGTVYGTQYISGNKQAVLIVKDV
jgi:hypothetical protein